MATALNHYFVSLMQARYRAYAGQQGGGGGEAAAAQQVEAPQKTTTTSKVKSSQVAPAPLQ